jgi:type I restriction enzyme, S subunit
MNISKHIPELRFPGFEDEWTEKKIGSLGTFLGGGTPDTTKPEFWKGQIPWISSVKLILL